MPRPIRAALAALALAACTQPPTGGTATAPAGRGGPERGGVTPPAGAVTAEQFDTTSPAERAAAAAPVSGERLGTTVGSLGNPAEPGFWAVTGLVEQVRPGRLDYPAGGTSVQVELRPSGGEAQSGTRVSLAAMRVLGVPLTDLPELVVSGR
ncbi:MAG: hypothetical protein ACK5JR_02945 [Tropicimonas sp.]|uniref:hypothetical protein n=1 Tax=Tropicimonas sp. TaxID=2067044 RepID=UPI003A859168